MERKLGQPKILLSLLQFFLQNYSAVQKRKQPAAGASAIVNLGQSSHATPAPIPWTKPPVGAFKLNIDAAVNASSYPPPPPKKHYTFATATAKANVLSYLKILFLPLSIFYYILKWNQGCCT
ncbi:hypothetical protein G4B88_023286 [Cannabis sativa]|uniref:Uncharacterized protein n=1 Tax=Cannabis sativa TaxID=3483 RepID=A0A7J6HZ21_CANSA|nr:hypothetical protein G4B88_023286 [Cannabis sativa]